MSDWLERELDEILRRFDQHPVRRRRRPTRWRYVVAYLGRAQNWLVARLSRIGLGQLMIASFLIICTAYFFRWVNPSLMRWVIIAGLLLFLTSFIFSLRRGSTPIQYERRWRGQRIDYGQPSLMDRVRAWLSRNR